MAVDLLKVADVLEKAAALIDAGEAEKVSAVRREREAAVKLLSDKYTETTGDTLSTEMLEKLSASDADILTTVQRITEKTAGAVESMGRSSERHDQEAKVPLTKQEQAKQAWDNFGSFLTR